MNDWNEYINRSMEYLAQTSEEFGFNDFVHGFNIGIVQFVSCPDGFDDVVCKIGDGWFYFAGTDGEGLTPTEYLYEVGIENALSQAYDYLVDGLEEVDSEEVAYYKAFLMEHREV